MSANEINRANNTGLKMICNMVFRLRSSRTHFFPLKIAHFPIKEKSINKGLVTINSRKVSTLKIFTTNKTNNAIVYKIIKPACKAIVKNSFIKASNVVIACF